MRSFTLGPYRIDVMSHARVFNPGRFVGGVSECFVVDCYDMIGGEPVPFDWNPNDVHHDDPDHIQREVFFFTGLQVQPVSSPFDPETNTQLSAEEGLERKRSRLPVEYRHTDMKRGADFRSRFFRTISERIHTADTARRLGIKIGNVTNEQLGRRPEPQEPVNLRGLTLNEAVTSLTGEAPVVAAQRPIR